MKHKLINFDWIVNNVIAHNLLISYINLIKEIFSKYDWVRNYVNILLAVLDISHFYVTWEIYKGPYITWCGNFVERQSLRLVSAETVPSTKFPYQETTCNYGILHSDGHLKIIGSALTSIREILLHLNYWNRSFSSWFITDSMVPGLLIGNKRLVSSAKLYIIDCKKTLCNS